MATPTRLYGIVLFARGITNAAITATTCGAARVCFTVVAGVAIVDTGTSPERTNACPSNATVDDGAQVIRASPTFHIAH